MADLNFVGRNLVTRNADGTYGQALEEDVVGIQNLPFRLSANQVGNADLTEIDLLPALGSEAFYIVHGIVLYPVANGGELPASGEFSAVYGGTAQLVARGCSLLASGAAVAVQGAVIEAYDSAAQFPLADVKNKTIALKSTGGTPIPIPGTIFSSAVGVAGAGYAVNDLFNIISTIDASVIGTGIVTGVTAGAVDTFTVLTSTLGAIRGAHTTVKTSGAGNDLFTVDVLALDYSTNAALIVGKLFYSTHSNVI